MKKYYVLERRVGIDRRKAKRKYLGGVHADRRRSEGNPPLVLVPGRFERSVAAYFYKMTDH